MRDLCMFNRTKKIMIAFFTMGIFLSPMLCSIGQGENGRKVSNGKMVTMNFDGVDIKVMVKFISELTGKNFVVGEKIKGKVTIISPTKITIDEAYRVFESVLEVNGYTTVPAGRVIKIIPSKEAKHRDVETRTGRELTAVEKEDKIITQLVPLEFADVNEIKKLFAPLISKNSSVVAYPATNTLILTDMSSNVHRLIRIIKEIDVPGSAEKITVVSLEYASAQTLSGELLSLFNAKGKRQLNSRKSAKGLPLSASGPIKIIPDERTNSLIVRASPQETTSFMELIEKLDQPTPRGKDRIHVYYLENATAEDLTGVLSKMPSKGKGGKGKAPALGEDVTVTADKPTNSLIISASPQDYAILKEIIKKLDITRTQVLVEALIAEISLDKSKQLGLEWRSVEEPRPGDYTWFGGTNLPSGTEGTGAIDQLRANPLASPTGLFMGVIKGVITLGDQEFLNLGALIRASQTDSDINILSTPHLLTMDNEEAEIVIGEERPFLKTSQVTDVGTTTKTFEYKDLGITLRITPQISKGGMVKLKIFLEIKTFIEQVEVGAINTRKRQAKTTVVVGDGDMVVIGGLIRDDLRKGSSSVPCLGDIPVLGWFFKTFSQGSTKINLMLFITPHIIRSTEDLMKITSEKKEESEKAKEEYDRLKENEIKDNLNLLIE